MNLQMIRVKVRETAAAAQKTERGRSSHSEPEGPSLFCMWVSLCVSCAWSLTGGFEFQGDTVTRRLVGSHSEDGFG